MLVSTRRWPTKPFSKPRVVVALLPGDGNQEKEDGEQDQELEGVACEFGLDIEEVALAISLVLVFMFVVDVLLFIIVVVCQVEASRRTGRTFATPLEPSYNALSTVQNTTFARVRLDRVDRCFMTNHAICSISVLWHQARV